MADEPAFLFGLEDKHVSAIRNASQGVALEFREFASDYRFSDGTSDCKISKYVTRNNFHVAPIPVLTNEINFLASRNGH